MWLAVLAAGLGAILGTVLSEVLDTARHRRLMARLDGPRKVPPSQLSRRMGVPPVGCNWHQAGGYGHVWDCHACLVAATAVYDEEPEGLLDEGEGLLC